MASLNRFQTGSQWNQRLGPNDNAKKALLCDFLSLKHYMKVTCSHFKHSTYTIQHITADSLIERRDLPADTLFKLLKRQTRTFNNISLHHITYDDDNHLFALWTSDLYWYLFVKAQIQFISAILIKKYIVRYIL